MIRHLVLLCIFAGTGAAVSLMLPQWLPAVSNIMSLVAGLATFLVLGLLAETVGRSLMAARQGRLLATLQSAQGTLEDELKWTRREVKAVREALEAAAHSGRLSQGPKAVDEILHEVTVLKDQIVRLSNSGKAAPREVPDHVAAPETGAGEDPLDTRGEPGELPPLRLSAEERAPLSEGLALVQRVKSAARQALPGLSSDRLLSEVRAALKDDRIEFVLQPIVSLPQRKHRAYECFSRLQTQDGDQLLPEQYIPVAEEAGLMAAIDNILLLRCIQLVRRVRQHERSLRFFCNISSHTLNDESFFGDLVAFLEANAEVASSLVFELSQADFESLGPGEIDRLERLASLGCRLSMDQVEQFELDAGKLAARGVRFVKLDAGALLELHDHDQDNEPRSLDRIKASLDRHRIDLIAEKIEDEPTLVELLDYQIDYGQGYLFGEPRPARMAA